MELLARRRQRECNDAPDECRRHGQRHHMAPVPGGTLRRTGLSVVLPHHANTHLVALLRQQPRNVCMYIC